MKHIKKHILFALALSAIASCSPDAEFIKLDSGLSYRLIESKEGKKVNQDDFMQIELKSYYKDSLVSEPRPEGGFFISPFEGAPEMLGDVLRKLTEGDSAEIKFSFKQYSDLTGLPIADDLDTTLAVMMHIRVIEINKEEVFMERVRVEIEKADAIQLGKEKALLVQYLQENEINTESTEEGLFYSIIKEGKGEKVKPGQTVVINYSLNLLDGTFIDTSVKEVAEQNGTYNANREPYEPFEFVVGEGTVIKGWDLGVSLLGKGGKATLYVPSTLGFGPNPRPGGDIPPNATLKFELEVVDIKN